MEKNKINLCDAISDCDIDKQKQGITCYTCGETFTMIWNSLTSSWCLGCRHFANHPDIEPQTSCDDKIRFKCE